ncbi:conserved hypothetical protein [Vibrio nigripulchritudo FTn2]|uniref:hypothetical protein n=1 Tax=Vibrio nigripulchritudo TaxID=28173 RepID=UPI0003B1A7C7|nr:hypothetical protein [Vibrio nigripulchritudo]BCL74159.1 hypothetical protein VNTUMSATTG_60960 [Vibrio nigripulchritudo]CCN41405.1 conserved hypothetical protein [Vibrio nigripulchritudo FTn2]
MEIFHDNRLSESEIESLNEKFDSTIYSSIEEYFSDLRAIVANENERHMIPGIEGSGTKRSPLERARVLVDKINAERRLNEHEEQGGTVVNFHPGKMHKGMH